MLTLNAVHCAQTMNWFLLILFTYCSFALPCKAGQIEFSQAGIAEIRGKSICEFAGDFSKRLGVLVDGEERYSVEYRERDELIAIFLLSDSRPPDYCGSVLDSKVITPKHKGDTVLFKCRLKNHANPGWGHIVGLGDNHLGQLRYVTASDAWKVDIKSGSFEKINGNSVVCDASGYTHARK